MKLRFSELNWKNKSNKKKKIWVNLTEHDKYTSQKYTSYVMKLEQANKKQKQKQS